MYDNRQLDVYELSILLYLFRLSNDGEAFPSLKNICETVKVSRPKVSKSIQTLIKKRLHDKKKHGKTKMVLQQATFTFY
ncbi:helix-turn-helix domain-containing protein [Listeria fleischmannii]|uniref:helix-turn-helix domain-containing protein n=1 Tax=Listeria fleischmannii TaxID=1069827 RepID=UPI00098D4330